jgi:hypothetical protein
MVPAVGLVVVGLVVGLAEVVGSVVELVAAEASIVHLHICYKRDNMCPHNNILLAHNIRRCSSLMPKDNILNLRYLHSIYRCYLDNKIYLDKHHNKHRLYLDSI